ncbi:MAG: RNA 2',3'-cyclic phosphodiesterase, partial [Acidimicrobiia bacterium]
MIRAFIAVELGEELRVALAEAQASLKATLNSRLQWVRPESLHVTLKFLGDVGEDRIPDLERAMTLVAGAHSGFSLEVGGLGVFPDSRQPRILWVGMSGSVERLVELAGELD